MFVRWIFIFRKENDVTSLLQELSEDTLTFEDCTKQYCDNVEYYYSNH